MVTPLSSMTGKQLATMRFRSRGCNKPSRLVFVGGISLCLSAPCQQLGDIVHRYFSQFNRDDIELHTNSIDNAHAEEAIGREIPLFSCPDSEIERTYYFRWWTYRKHLRRQKGTLDEWVVTEFLPDVPWAGEENTISCPFGHHVREGRWLRESKYIDSYINFMLTKGRISGADAYLCWPAWAALERAYVTGDFKRLQIWLDAFVHNYEIWRTGWRTSGHSLKKVENRQGAKAVSLRAGFRAERGLFDFTGDCEGTEFALSSDGARPMVNAAMWAEATAIAKIARRIGRTDVSDLFARRAAELAQNVFDRLWNSEKNFFTVLSVEGILDDVCELHGYAPFYFGMPTKGFESAWDKLMRTDGFLAPSGLTYPARATAGFDVSSDLMRHECLWNGPSWPYATSVTLTGLYRSLQEGSRISVTAADFALLMHQYAAQHVRIRPDGSRVPWIDENVNPFTGEWIAREHLMAWDRQGLSKMALRERGKDYNHSTFCDLVISGICGIIPQEDGQIVIKPLAPPEWDWWCISGVRYHGRDLSVFYDRNGSRFGRGNGLVVLEDGKIVRDAMKNTVSNK